MNGSVTKYKITGSSRPRWRYRIYVGKDVDGNKIYEGRGGFQKECDARDSMRDHIAAIKTRQASALAPPLAAEKTLGEWTATWLDTYAVVKCQPKTLERYRTLAEYLKAPGPPAEVSATVLSKVTAAQLEAAFFSLLHAKAKRHEHVSARTVRHMASLVNVALNKAFKLDLIPVNPMLKVELPKWKKKDARSLTRDEIQALREVCRGDWTFALVEVALATGARRGELLALLWSDLEWISGVLTFSKSLEQTKAGLRIKGTKGEKTRQCRLPRSALAALQFQRDQQAEQRRLFGGDYYDQGLIFCEADGNYHDPALVSQTIVRRLQKAGIRNASLHSLRHSHASNLLSRGVPLPAVSVRLGHADANVTARIYSHAIPADDQRAADAWDSLIDGKVQ